MSSSLPVHTGNGIWRGCALPWNILNVIVNRWSMLLLSDAAGPSENPKKQMPCSWKQYECSHCPELFFPICISSLNFMQCIRIIFASLPTPPRSTFPYQDNFVFFPLPRTSSTVDQRCILKEKWLCLSEHLSVDSHSHFYTASWRQDIQTKKHTAECPQA